MKNSKNAFLLIACACFMFCVKPAMAQTAPSPADLEKAANAKIKSNEETVKKAGSWAESLELNDKAKEERVAKLIADHLIFIRDWHNEHPFTTVPAGINPITGKELSKLERQMIANSAMPKTVQQTLVDGLQKELTPEQFEKVLDKYTIGKVEFTMNGYRSIVPNITPLEESTILAFLKQARIESISYKNMDQISAIFEIYKTKSEQYLNANGRSWKQMYKAYTDAAKARKAAAAEAAKPAAK